MTTPTFDCLALNLFYCERYRCKLTEDSCREYQRDYEKTNRCLGCGNNDYDVGDDRRLKSKKKISGYRRMKLRARREDAKWHRLVRERGFESELHMYQYYYESEEMSLAQIARTFGVSKNTITHRASKLGIRRRKRGARLKKDRED